MILLPPQRQLRPSAHHLQLLLSQLPPWLPSVNQSRLKFTAPLVVPAATERSIERTAETEPSWQMLWLCMSPATYGLVAGAGVAAKAVPVVSAAPRISAVFEVIEVTVTISLIGWCFEVLKDPPLRMPITHKAMATSVPARR